MNLPSGPVWPVGINLAWAVCPWECNVTRMPCRGFPLYFTTPVTGAVEGTESPLPHPPRGAAASAKAPSRGGSARFRQRRMALAVNRLIVTNDLVLVPAPERSIRGHV